MLEFVDFVALGDQFNINLGASVNPVINALKKFTTIFFNVAVNLQRVDFREPLFSNGITPQKFPGGIKQQKSACISLLQKIRRIRADIIQTDSQKENNGFIFPKNYDLVSENSSYARTYVKEEGLLMYTDNEMVHFGTDYIRSMITINKPLDENGEPINPTDLAENCTLNIELQNYGYQDQLTLYLHNSLGDLVVANLNIETRMNKANTYSINLYKYEEMSTSLTSVDILYSSLGVDNALLIKSIYFTSFERDDVPGINFSDKYVLGFSSTSDIDVSYNRSRYMTKFDVKNASDIPEYDLWRFLHYFLQENNTI